MGGHISPSRALSPPFASCWIDKEVVNLGREMLNVAQDKSCLLEGNENGNRKLFFYNMA